MWHYEQRASVATKLAEFLVMNCHRDWELNAECVESPRKWWKSLEMPNVGQYLDGRSSLSLRSYSRLGSAVSVYMTTRFGSSVSLLDFIFMGSSLALRCSEVATSASSYLKEFRSIISYHSLIRAWQTNRDNLLGWAGQSSCLTLDEISVRNDL